MTWTAVSPNPAGAIHNVTSASITTHAVGNLIVLINTLHSDTAFPTGVSSSRVTWVKVTGSDSSFSNSAISTAPSQWQGNIWLGTVTSVGTDTVTFTYTGGITPSFTNAVMQEFTSSAGSWHVDTFTTLNSAAGVAAWPSLTPAGNGELYLGFAWNQGSAVSGSTTGYVYNANADGASNGMAYNLNCAGGTATAPTWGDSTETYGLMVLVAEGSATSLPGLIPGNELTLNTQSLETDASDWSAGTNSTIAQSSAHAFDGTESLAITATASGTANIITNVGNVPFPPVTPGSIYQFFFAAYTTSSGINVSAQGDFYNVSTFVSSLSPPTVTLQPNTWTWVSVTQAAPATATLLRPIPQFTATAAGQVVYIDSVYFGRPTMFPGPYTGTDGLLGTPAVPGQAQPGNFIPGQVTQPLSAAPPGPGMAQVSPAWQARFRHGDRPVVPLFFPPPPPAVTANAGLATVSAAANGPAPAVSPNAGSATASATANAPVSVVQPAAGQAAVAAQASAPALSVTASAGLAVVSATANQPVPAATATAGAAAVGATASAPTVLTGTVANAGAATVTATASGPVVTAAATAGAATVTAAASAPVPVAQPNAGAAAVTAAASAPALSVTASAGLATVNAPANAPAPSVTVSAGAAAVSGTANTPVPVVRPGAGQAAAITAAGAPVPVGQPNAGQAQVAVAGNAPSVIVALSDSDASAGTDSESVTRYDFNLGQAMVSPAWLTRWGRQRFPKQIPVFIPAGITSVTDADAGLGEDAEIDNPFPVEQDFSGAAADGGELVAATVKSAAFTSDAAGPALDGEVQPGASDKDAGTGTDAGYLSAAQFADGETARGTDRESARFGPDAAPSDADAAAGSDQELIDVYAYQPLFRWTGGQFSAPLRPRFPVPVPQPPAPAGPLSAAVVLEPALRVTVVISADE